VAETLDAVARLAEGRRAGLALELAVHAMDRIGDALGDIDDSAGHGGALLHQAREVHLEAARAAAPDPVRLAGELYAREMADEYGAFDGTAALYAEALGDAGLAEYRRLAIAAWEALPQRSGRGRGAEAYSTDVYRLERILDFFAERAGDVDARIALRAKNVASPWSYVELAGFCRAQGRGDEALRRAEEGLWMFEDEAPDERLVFLAVDLLCAAGRAADAEAHLWRAFGKAPSIELYARLRGLGGDDVRERAVGVLEARLAGKDRALRDSPADLLVRILMREELPDAAWASVGRNGASLAVREALARVSETSHPGEALAVYAERVERLADQGGNPAYAEAAALARHMGTLRSAAEQAAYIGDLKARFGRRRNLMKRLDGAAR
jgi:hypothetical protein